MSSVNIRLIFNPSISQEIKEKIVDDLVEKDYDFPKDCIKWVEWYRKPSLTAEQIVKYIFTKYQIDDVQVYWSIDDSSDEKYITYKNTCIQEINEQKYKELFANLAKKYKLENLGIYARYDSYDLETNWSLSLRLNDFEIRISKSHNKSYTQEDFERIFEKFVKIVESIKE